MIVDQRLLEKYNVAVPRYTSYPPANHFTDNFSPNDYSDLIVQSNTQEPEHLAFYIHIPFCKQICFYCGCNFEAMVKSTSVERYINTVIKEIDLVTKHIDKKRKVSQIHYGGGTPNAIEARYLKQINEYLFNKFDFIDNAEIAIECNPALLSWEYMDQLFDAGFNRFSFGIQDFDNDILSNVNRLPSALDHAELINYIKKHDSSMAVNLDFIYGLPQQDVESFGKTISKAIELKPDRVVTFSYAHVPWLKTNQRILERKGLPDANSKMAMFLEGYKLMKQANYTPIGLDHYALPTDELATALNNKQLHRNFQGYCTTQTTGQVYAFGVSGISQLSNAFIQNTKDQFKYQNLVNKGILPVEKGYILKQNDKIIGGVINHLMCNKHIDWKQISERFKISVTELKSIITYNTEKLKEFKADKLLEFNDNEIYISELGTLFIRNIVSSLDPAIGTSKNSYSKSV